VLVAFSGRAAYRRASPARQGGYASRWPSATLDQWASPRPGHSRRAGQRRARPGPHLEDRPRSNPRQ